MTPGAPPPPTISTTRERTARQRGTGAKAATLYQRFSPFGFAGLAPERVSATTSGSTRCCSATALTVSATVFDTRYRDLIDFADIPACTTAQLAAGGGCYYNVGRADTQGVELSGDVALVPDVWRARASYTYLDARDLDTTTRNCCAAAPTRARCR